MGDYRIAVVWVVISLTIAVFIGLVGRTLFPTALTTSSEAENVFILLSTNLLPPLIAGFVMAGILAATISSSDSYLLALDENSVIFTIVSFAWAGFGATFGPLMLFSLFWKRTTRAGAVAGMIGGGVMVFVWNLLVRPLGGLWDIYELLPAFLFSCLCIIVVSLLTPEPSEEIRREFAEVKEGR